MTQPPIRVVCDRCRTEGLPGEDVFAAFGALLDFDPVPRRTARADGWDPEVQRAFVAALSLTGSVRQAARAVGKAAYGAEQLLRADGSEGFRAACEAAMEVAGDERSRRLAEGLRAVAQEQAGWRPADPPWSRAATRRNAAPEPPPAPSAEEEERATLTALDATFQHYMQRLSMERRARLEGRICEADFYLRQITVLEIGLQLIAGGAPDDAIRAVRDLRAGGHHINWIAETTMSRLLDKARRAQWAALGEPERPPPLRPDQMVDRGEIKLLKDSSLPGGPDLRERERAQDREYEEAAREQVEWEAAARRDYERRRDSGAAS